MGTGCSLCWCCLYAVGVRSKLLPLGGICICVWSAPCWCFRYAVAVRSRLLARGVFVYEYGLLPVGAFAMM
jgi:hypothetical protein